MRTRAAGVALLLAALVVTGGCSSGGGDAATTAAACGNMKRAIGSFNAQLSSDPQVIGKAYADVARRLRALVAGVNDESVRTAALRVAAALEGLANDMRTYAAGDFTAPATDRLTTAVAELQQACTS
jgi:hypothetical protein